jgi:hypothetical protein
MADLAKIESRIAALEQHLGGQDRDEIRRLWSEVRNETSVTGLLDHLRTATADRRPPQRAQIHGTIDTLVANGDNGLLVTPTIVVTSSEPCVIIVATIITLTVCDN